MWARNGIVVVCSTSLENMQRNQAESKSRGDYHGALQKDVVENYAKLLSKTGLPLTVYDYSVPLTGDLLDRLIDAHSGSEDIVWDWKTTSLGTSNPDIWLVGAYDGPNLRRFDQAVFYDEAGDYLRRVLNCTDLKWDRVRLSGTLGYIKNEYMWLDRPKHIVALGRTAHDMLTTLGLEHKSVPHPAHWMRSDLMEVAIEELMLAVE